jgi:uncharacterized membrane protein (DUF4010 family)
MRSLSEKVTFGMVGVVGGVTGIAASSGACGASGCLTCFGCAGMGLVLVAATFVKRAKEARHGRNIHHERNTAINHSLPR